MRLFALCLVLAALAAPACAQTLTVSGPAGTVTLGQAELESLPRRTLDTQREGRTLHWEGPTLEAILAKVGAPLGDAAKGPVLASYVIVEGSDGFRTLLSLAEADPTFHPPGAVIADRVNRGPLSAAEGPLRLVTSGDLKPTRSVRNVVAIRLETAGAAPRTAGMAPPPATAADPPRP